MAERLETRYRPTQVVRRTSRLPGRARSRGPQSWRSHPGFGFRSHFSARV